MSQATLPASWWSWLPMPKVRLQPWTQAQPFAVIDRYKYGGNTTGWQYRLYNYPEIVTMDLTDEQIEKGVWVEMLTYNRGKSQYSTWNTDAWYKVPVSRVGWVNTLWNLDTRWGWQWFINAGALAVDRPNHFQVTDRNQVLPVRQYLHNRMSQIGIRYWDAATNTDMTQDALTVAQWMRATWLNYAQNKFWYSPRYRPLYFKFRYIMKADDGYSYVSWPLTPVIKLAQKEHPFDFDPIASWVNWRTSVNLNAWADPWEAQCRFGTRLP